jgi:amidohydrolase
MAVLMGVAEVLAGIKDRLPGTVKFIFQPAEEGAPQGEQGGAELMIKEGAFENPRPDVIFGLHVLGVAGNVGQITYRPAGIMASADLLRITIRGKQTHGAIPWGGVDPIVVASQVVLGIQTISSRQLDVTQAPSIITIGSIHGGVRNNIIPDEVRLEGTIRAFSPEMQDEMHRRIRLTAESIAQSAGATANVEIVRQYPVTFNNPALTEQMLPTLKRVAGAENDSLRRRRQGCSFFWGRIRKVSIRPVRRPITLPCLMSMKACCRLECGRWQISPWTICRRNNRRHAARFSNAS